MSPRGVEGETAPPFQGRRKGRGRGSLRSGVSPPSEAPLPHYPSPFLEPRTSGWGGRREIIQGVPGGRAGWEPGGLGPGWRWGIEWEEVQG